MRQRFFAAGIAAKNWLWLRPSLVLVSLALVAILCGLACPARTPVRWLPLVIFWCLLGAWCTEMEPHAAPAPALAALSDGLLRTAEGTVVDADPVRNEIEQDLNDNDLSQPAAAEPVQQPSQRIDLQVTNLEIVTDADDAQSPIAGGVRLTVRWPVPH
jgi:competence protein ComEC